MSDRILRHAATYALSAMECLPDSLSYATREHAIALLRAALASPPEPQGEDADLLESLRTAAHGIELAAIAADQSYCAATGSRLSTAWQTFNETLTKIRARLREPTREAEWRAGVPLAGLEAVALLKSGRKVAGRLRPDGFAYLGGAVNPYEITHYLPLPPAPVQREETLVEIRSTPEGRAWAEETWAKLRAEQHPEQIAPAPAPQEARVGCATCGMDALLHTAETHAFVRPEPQRAEGEREIAPVPDGQGGYLEPPRTVPAPVEPQGEDALESEKGSTS